LSGVPFEQTSFGGGSEDTGDRMGGLAGV